MMSHADEYNDVDRTPCKDHEGMEGSREKLSPHTRRSLITLINLFPVHAKNLVKLIKELNVMALKEGERPVGPDLDMSPELMVRAVLSSFLDRKSFR